MSNTILDDGIEKGHIAKKLPLTFEQERLWFKDQFYIDTEFNHSFLLKLSGIIDIKVLERSINEIIKRHDSLRANFLETTGVPSQIIKPFKYFQLPVSNFTQLKDEEKSLEIEKRIQKEFNHSFNLTSDLLFRCNLIIKTNEEYILIINSHQMVFNYCSQQTFVRELSLLYKSFYTGTRAELPDVSNKYESLLESQRIYVTHEEIANSLEYWKRKLGGDIPELSIPMDYARQSISKFEGRTFYHTISNEIYHNLKIVAEQEKTSPFLILVTAIKVLLYRYSGETDICIGVMSGRTNTELMSLIGLDNTIVLRSQFMGDYSFKEVLLKVKNVVIEAENYQDIPFAKIISEVNPKRNLYNGTPFFNVIVQEDKENQSNIKIPDIEVSEIDTEIKLASVDLQVKVAENDRDIRCSFLYDTHLFKEETIKRLAGHLNTLLEQFMINTNTLISKATVLTDKERYQLLVEWNSPTIQYPRDATIHQLFEEQVKLVPENVALVYGEIEITYNELNNRANQIAQHLLRSGIKQEQLVAIYLERSPDIVASFLGVLKAGGAYVPIDPTYPQERISYMLEDSAVSFIITNESLKGKLPKVDAYLFNMDEYGYKDIIRSDQCTGKGNAKDLAYVMYTSGSTGKPKGVAVEHRGIVRLVKNIIYADTGPMETYLNLGSVAFDVSAFEIYGALLNGGKLVILNTHNPSFDEIANTIKEKSVTSLNVTPERLNILLEDYCEELVGLKQILPGGEALPVWLAQKCLSKLKKCKLINLYGPTENSVNTTSYHVREIHPNLSSIPIGRPISNDSIYILDQFLQPVPIGVIGELYISGDGIARGYLNKAELTKERFPLNPFEQSNGKRLYKSGDLARYCADGNIEYIGRIDDQVKVRGCRIELGEIESIIGMMPDIRQAIAGTTIGPDGTKSLVAYVVMNKGKKFNQQSIRAYLREKLPAFMVPSFFVELEKVPVTPVGKIDRKKLPPPTFSLSNENIVLPRTEVEAKLVNIWESILNISPIGIKERYFEIGGNSLLAMRMFSEIKKTFKKSLPVSIIFQEDTIERLAKYLSSFDQASDSSLVPIQPQGTKPPLFCVHGGGGEVLIYRGLSVSLGVDYPVYGLRYTGSQNDTSISVESLAEKYIEDIREIQPAGPYYILGFCFGGAIAYEMSNKLLKAGQEVAVLAILNFGNPAHKPAPAGNIRKEMSIKNVIEKNLRTLYKMPLNKKVTFLVEKTFNAAKLLLNNSGEPSKEYKPDPIRETLTKAINLYNPKPYPGKILLIHANKDVNSKERLGWEVNESGRLIVRAIPTEHETLLKQPHVESVAEYLVEQIENSELVIEKNDYYPALTGCNTSTSRIQE